MASPMSYWLSQLVSQAPALLVYLVGIILALIHLRRGAPAILCLIGCSVLLTTSLLFTFLQWNLIQQRGASGSSAAQMAQMLTILSTVSGVLRALAIAALIAAIFTRRREDMPAFEPTFPTSPPPVPGRSYQGTARTSDHTTR